MKTRFYLFPLVALAITACGGQTEEQTKKETKVYSELEKAAWFLGNWENNFPEGGITESWEQANDSTYTGRSLVVIGKDTVSSETLRLEEQNGKLMYIPTVSDQNGGREVVFTLTKNNGKMLVFENPKHDFPQKITYTRISGDSIVAEISGTMDGKPASEQFPMSRKK
ncbi:MAG: hypothetical protein K0R65_592 [Crocinitomicaceae bacterium]|jgi:hypothetical protein|nr:hypothetical protein [Crocinitomicaceae bacterium]